MGCNPGGIVGVVLSLKDNAWPCLLPVGSVSDGADCRRSLCALNDRRCASGREFIAQGVLSTRDDGMDADADVNDLFCNVLGKTRERGRLSLGKAARLLIAG